MLWASIEHGDKKLSSRYFKLHGGTQAVLVAMQWTIMYGHLTDHPAVAWREWVVRVLERV